MRFLVNAQLPLTLSWWLSDQGHQSVHVVDIGMVSAHDNAIWDYARTHGKVMITKDEDFARRRAIAVAESEPAVLWIRKGNSSRRELLVWFAALFPSKVEALYHGETLIEVI